jgi:hypothetical protein
MGAQPFDGGACATKKRKQKHKVEKNPGPVLHDSIHSCERGAWCALTMRPHVDSGVLTAPGDHCLRPNGATTNRIVTNVRIRVEYPSSGME